jgi:hypothetical protein
MARQLTTLCLATKMTHSPFLNRDFLQKKIFCFLRLILDSTISALPPASPLY